MLFRSLSPVREVPAVGSRRSDGPRRWNAARLRVEALEDRSLPSGIVTLAPNDDSPLVGERVTWTATADRCRGDPRLPVQRRDRTAVTSTSSATSAPPTRSPGPRCRRATTTSRSPSRTATRRPRRRPPWSTDEVASRVTGSQAVVTPTANPLVALYSVPPSYGGDGLRPVRRRGRQPGVAEHRRPRRRAGDEHQLLRGGDAAEHDLPDAARVQRRHRLRAHALHDGSPARRL